MLRLWAASVRWVHCVCQSDAGWKILCSSSDSAVIWALVHQTAGSLQSQRNWYLQRLVTASPTLFCSVLSGCSSFLSRFRVDFIQERITAHFLFLLIHLMHELAGVVNCSLQSCSNYSGSYRNQLVSACCRESCGTSGPVGNSTLLLLKIFSHRYVCFCSPHFSPPLIYFRFFTVHRLLLLIQSLLLIFLPVVMLFSFIRSFCFPVSLTVLHSLHTFFADLLACCPSPVFHSLIYFISLVFHSLSFHLPMHITRTPRFTSHKPETPFVFKP